MNSVIIDNCIIKYSESVVIIKKVKTNDPKYSKVERKTWGSRIKDNKVISNIMSDNY